jgi:hypothetical protein
MPKSLAILLTGTDVAFVAYWSLSALAVLGFVHLPPEWMYAGYGDPVVAAWNWSFLPLDLGFSAFGLTAVRLARLGDPRWRPAALVSVSFTMAAGGMAVGYWTLLRQFDPAWFLPNLFLLVWPVFFLPGLLAGRDRSA